MQHEEQPRPDGSRTHAGVWNLPRKVLVWVIIPGVVHAAVILLLMHLQFLVTRAAAKEAVIDTALEEIDIRDNPVEHLAPTNIKTSAVAEKRLDWRELLKPDTSKVDKPDERDLEKVMEATEDEPLQLAKIAVPANALTGIPKLGATTEGKTSVAAVVDALSRELAKMLTKRKVLLVWLFDMSRSTRRSQKEVRERITKLYAELQGATGAGGQAKLVSAVVGYGKETESVLREPSAKPAEVQQAMDRISISTTADENVMTACRDVLKRYAPRARLERRALVIFIVTDECGDDLGGLEAVIAMAKSTQPKTRVFVLGGQSRFQQNYLWPRHVSLKAPPGVHNLPASDPRRRKWTVPARQNVGPECAFPETLYAYEHESPWNGIPKFQSGFGYWALSRLAQSTEGVYYVLFGEKGPTYDPETMAPYTPEFCSKKEYVARCKANRIRGTIHLMHQELSEVPFHWSSTRSRIPARLLPRSEKYPFYGHLRPDSLRKDLETAARLAQRRIEKLGGMIKTLETGSLANAPAAAKRWEANRQLALADACALRWSAQQYLLALEDFKRHPRLERKARYYRVGGTGLYSTKKHPILGGEKAQATLKEVYAKYEAVMTNHAGTPWADTARRWRRITFYKVVPVYPPKRTGGSYTPPPPPPPI